MIKEQLRCGSTRSSDPSVSPATGQLDIPCGRQMSDVSSMFIVYIMELYKWANDTETLTTLWPNVKLAAQWHITRAQKYGVPLHLVNTYDVLGINIYLFEQGIKVLVL